jgi:hypothetical protein
VHTCYTFRMFPRIRRHAFALFLGFALALVRFCFILDLIAAVPTGTAWLGSTIANPADQAVYLSYLTHVADGANSLVNLFAPPDDGVFFHPFYLLLGWIVRGSHLSPMLAMEVTATTSLFIAAFLLHAVSQHLTDNEHAARLITGLVCGSGGLGWAYLVLATHFGWSSANIPDLAGEAFFAPTLLMAPHVLVSFALLPFALSRFWMDAQNGIRRPTTLAALFFLLLVHPYFAPLVGLVGWLAWFTQRRPWSFFWPAAGVCAVALLPALWMMVSAPSRRFFLSTEAVQLPLAPALAILAAFFPWFLFLAWRWHKSIPLAPPEQFLAAWAVAIGVTLTLPIAWPRKLLQSTGPLFIWLCIPSLLASKAHLRTLGRLFPAAGIFLLVVSPLLVLKTQLAWTHGSAEQRATFYAPNEAFLAWGWIRQHTEPRALVFPDKVEVGLWTPAFANRATWIGHEFETPDFATKRAELQRFMELQDPRETRATIERSGATVILASSSSSAALFEASLDPLAWRPAATFGAYTVLTKYPPNEEIGQHPPTQEDSFARR